MLLRTQTVCISKKHSRPINRLQADAYAKESLGLKTKKPRSNFLLRGDIIMASIYLNLLD
ncbi:hypothetical protein VCRA2133E348_150015 [Vibrio crassostreae]|nr:hypothetical protein VCRA2133E348_150015 [Vibrio crassostreae]CAK3155239.1 hypothetical protein VCRA213O314_130015 [Vibrio crassostreae]